MDLDQKMICYRKPITGYTMDIWDVLTDSVPIHAQSYEFIYRNNPIVLEPSLCPEGRPVLLHLHVDPDMDPLVGSRSDKLSSLLLKCELYEPPGGWSEVVSWNLANSKGK